MMAQIDPALVFALGALCMLTLILLVGFGVELRIASWVWTRLRESDDLELKREDGKIKIGGTLVDLARPGRVTKKKQTIRYALAKNGERRPS